MKIELILSIYASIIATLVFLWKIYAYFNDRKATLNISQKIINQFIVSNWGVESGSETQHLQITITNTGNSQRYIERPAFQINKKINGVDTFSVITVEEMQISYPRAIQPSQRIDFNIPIDGVKQKLLEAAGASKVKSVVVDTHGKKFTSKWLTID